MAKIVTQIIVLGGQIVARAFTRAIKQEFEQSAHKAAGRRPNNPSPRSYEMSLDEARRILNIENRLEKSELDKKFQHLFEVNDKNKGGSFYLQSKVVRAKETLDKELSKSNSSGDSS